MYYHAECHLAVLLSYTAHYTLIFFTRVLSSIHMFHSVLQLIIVPKAIHTTLYLSYFVGQSTWNTAIIDVHVVTFFYQPLCQPTLDCSLAQLSQVTQRSK